MRTLDVIISVIMLCCTACGDGKLPDPDAIWDNSGGVGDELASLKELYEDDFLIGTSLNSTGGDMFARNGAGWIYKNFKINSLVTSQFNTVVTGNTLKPQPIQPSEGNFNFIEADKFVDYGERNNMWITGHVLVWHNQTGAWMFKDDVGNNASRDLLLERMKTHINTLVNRYKGRIDGWDVVNEAIDGGKMRESQWFNIVGEEYIDSAFSYAHQADPNAELYYNDYNLNNENKRNATVDLIRRLKSQNIRIDAVGMQGHYGLNTSIDEIEESIIAFYNEGVKVMITEMDISVLPNPPWHTIEDAEIGIDEAYDAKYDPYAEGLPIEVEVEQAKKYRDLFALFLKHKDKITRVTFWGQGDADSWKNNHPIKGRTNYPMLFDRDYEPKKAFDEVVGLKQ